MLFEFYGKKAIVFIIADWHERVYFEVEGLLYLPFQVGKQAQVFVQGVCYILIFEWILIRMDGKSIHHPYFFSFFILFF